jgi:hypothetical protein
MRRIYEVIVNASSLRMRNYLLKRGEWTDKNLTGCLQIYVVLQYERMIKYLILNTNNVAL